VFTKNFSSLSGFSAAGSPISETGNTCYYHPRDTFNFLCRTEKHPAGEIPDIFALASRGQARLSRRTSAINPAGFSLPAAKLIMFHLY
jgi:hypothetical protein